jgi:hypothetical protein
LDARVLKGFQRSLGGLYQSVLRAELTARYGVAFCEIDKGQAEIAGVPERLLEQFSKRTAQVDRAFQTKLADFYAREGRDPTPKERGALGREAAEDSRGHKTGNGVVDLRSRWLTEAAAVGVSPDTLLDGIEQAALSPPVEPQRVVIEDVIGAVTERRSAWHRLDVLQAVCDTARPVPGESPWDCWRLLILETRMESCRRRSHQGSRRRVGIPIERRIRRLVWFASCGPSWAPTTARCNVSPRNSGTGSSRCARGFVSVMSSTGLRALTRYGCASWRPTTRCSGSRTGSCVGRMRF